MLVLTRKRSEMIQIGDNVVIKVLQIGPRVVKIGIAAPADVRVIRGELARVKGVCDPLSAIGRERWQHKSGKEK